MKPVSFKPVILGIILALSLVLTQHAMAQGNQVLGAAADGTNALEFVEQIDQNGLDLVGYGYVTHLSGLADSELFSDPDPTKWYAPTARITFSATGKLTDRYTFQNIIATDSVGTLTYYFNEKPQADFKDAKSFATGTPIATFSLRLQNILTVTQPDTGLAMGTGELLQQSTSKFTLNGKSYNLGYEGLIQRSTSFGSGKRTDPKLPQSQFAIAGNNFVIKP